MRVSSVILASTVLILAALPLRAQVVTEYRLVEPEFLPTSLEESYHDGRFTISIDRQFNGAQERALLERAESLMPSRHLIVRAADSVLTHLAGPAQQWQRNFDHAEAIPGDRWWWIEWDEVLLPFALTGRAVRHYVDRTRHLASIPNPLSRDDDGGPFHRASFEYGAVVVATDSGGRVVELTARWSFWCGQLCALGFQHTRTVEFDSDGTVISVLGDRPAEYWVS